MWKYYATSGGWQKRGKDNAHIVDASCCIPGLICVHGETIEEINHNKYVSSHESRMVPSSVPVCINKEVTNVK